MVEVVESYFLLDIRDDWNLALLNTPEASIAASAVCLIYFPLPMY